MDPAKKSMALFILGCLPVRILAVYVAKNHHEALIYMSIIAFIISVGFAYIWLFKLRKTGGETFGQPIWWDDLRPVHSFLYLSFAYMALYKPDVAWVALAMDVFIGALAFSAHRLV